MWRTLFPTTVCKHCSNTMEVGEIFCRICGRGRLLPVKQWQVVVFMASFVMLMCSLFTLLLTSSSNVAPEIPATQLLASRVISSPVAISEIYTVSPSPSPTPTPKSQLTETEISKPSPTRTPHPTQTATRKPSPTSTRIPPSPTAAQATCSQASGPRWGPTLWNQYKYQLGCPLGQEIRTGGAYQIYQRGIAVWRQDAERIYILYNNGTHTSYPDDSPNGYYHSNMLKGGFGYLWNNNSTIREGLGDPVTTEANATNFAVQDFDNGTIFYFLENEANNYILFSGSNAWTSTQD